MRDDLHHSLPLTSPWRSVVKAACSPNLNGHLIDVLTRAAWASSASWWDSAWGLGLRTLLEAKQLDMFGQEQLERAIEKLERTAPDHSARRACEIACGAMLNGEPTGTLASQVLRATLESGIEDGIELAAARIEKEHPGRHGADVRRRLYAEIPNCNLSERPGPKKRVQKASVEDGLRVALPITI